MPLYSVREVCACVVNQFNYKRSGQYRFLNRRAVNVVGFESTKLGSTPGGGNAKKFKIEHISDQNKCNEHRRLDVHNACLDVGYRLKDLDKPRQTRCSE